MVDLGKYLSIMYVSRQKLRLNNESRGETPMYGLTELQLTPVQMEVKHEISNYISI